eukprot:1147236_1
MQSVNHSLAHLTYLGGMNWMRSVMTKMMGMNSVAFEDDTRPISTTQHMQIRKQSKHMIMKQWDSQYPWQLHKQNKMQERIDELNAKFRGYGNETDSCKDNDAGRGAKPDQTVQESEITHIKQQLTALEEWKDTIGVPTQQQNEDLRIINDGLKCEIKVVEYKQPIEQLMATNDELNEANKQNDASETATEPLTDHGRTTQPKSNHVAVLKDPQYNTAKGGSKENEPQTIIIDIPLTGLMIS